MENRALAEKIHEFEQHQSKASLDEYLKWFKAGLPRKDLGNGIKLEMSNDSMCWYIWKRFPDQVRSFVKVIPRLSLDVDSLEKIIAAQPWTCI